MQRIPTVAALLSLFIASVAFSRNAPAADPALAKALAADVTTLATEIGPRAVARPDALKRAADFIAGRLTAHGAVKRLGYEVDGTRVENIELEFPGTTRRDEIVVIGAHYDTVPTTPGADDNARGVAALLQLAKAYAAAGPQARTVRFVAFANEEPPYFQTDAMGSVVYANACRARGDKVVAMLSLESIGFYSEQKGSQHYPSALMRLFFSSRGNFLAIVGNKPSKPLVRSVERAFKEHGGLPVKAVAVSEDIQGVGWSDHWAFWKAGYPAVMLTDTAPMRNPHYHRGSDTPESLDYVRFAHAVGAIDRTLRALAGEKTEG